MPGQARMLDIGVGICCCHPPIPCIPMSGIVITSSGTAFCNGFGAARMTDIIIGFCGHPGIIITGVSATYQNGLPAASLGSLFVGCFSGTIIQGSTDTQV